MKTNFENLRQYGPVLLRAGISLVFLWFGTSQIFKPTDFTGFLPGFLAALPIKPNDFVFMNGTFEVIFGLLLITGTFTRIAALLLGLHLGAIAATLGINQIGVRDFGLTLSTLSIALLGEDKFCLDSKKGIKFRIILFIAIVAIVAAAGSFIHFR